MRIKIAMEFVLDLLFNKFLPQTATQRIKVLEWLFWQVGGLGPMAGQVSHFVNYAPNFPGDHSYSEKRYRNEYDRLLGVMDNILSKIYRNRQHTRGNTHPIIRYTSAYESSNYHN